MHAIWEGTLRHSRICIWTSEGKSRNEKFGVPWPDILCSSAFERFAVKRLNEIEDREPSSTSQMSTSLPANCSLDLNRLIYADREIEKDVVED